MVSEDMKVGEEDQYVLKSPWAAAGGGSTSKWMAESHLSRAKYTVCQKEKSYEFSPNGSETFSLPNPEPSQY